MGISTSVDKRTFLVIGIVGIILIGIASAIFFHPRTKEPYITDFGIADIGHGLTISFRTNSNKSVLYEVEVSAPDIGFSETRPFSEPQDYNIPAPSSSCWHQLLITIYNNNHQTIFEEVRFFQMTAPPNISPPITTSSD